MKKVKQILGGSALALALLTLIQFGADQSVSSDSTLYHTKSGASTELAKKGSFDEPIDSTQTIAKKGSFDDTVNSIQTVARKGSFDDQIDGAQVVARKGSFDEPINAA